MTQTSVLDVFSRCVEAAVGGKLIVRKNKDDKEFHFQNWFAPRLDEMGKNYDEPKRNKYPDFTLVDQAEGYELKALAYPGRDANYDANSQMPFGVHNGRTIFYVFGRYPKGAVGEYPLVDLVVCHGSFLNADNDYVHENKSVKGFGSYGDIAIRDRKMYVVPTPFALASGLNAMRTLILPREYEVPDRFIKVGDLVRKEADRLVVAYKFDLTTNEIEGRTVENPNAGREHAFVAYRLASDPASSGAPSVELVEPAARIDTAQLELGDE